MGPDKDSKLSSIKTTMGEQSNKQQLYQKQLAATMAKLLGLEFKAAHPIGDPIF
jgi:hypothetical protein